MTLFKRQPGRTKTAFITAVFALLFISACAPGEKKPDSTQTPLTDKPTSLWSVTLEIAGGIAGKMQRISLDQTGTAVLVDMKLKTQTETKLDQVEIQRYANTISSLPVSKQTVTHFSQCRDCFVYTLSITSESGRQRMTMDDLQLQHSAAKDLIQMLSNLASEMNRRK